MNLHANAGHTNAALMQHVERAVRPLAAGKRRKLQMREELLAHLSAIYDQELAERQDAAAALAAAKNRFGDPLDLSRELARTLTWRDGWDAIQERWAAAVDRTFSWQRGESFVRFAVRSGVWIAGLVAALAIVSIAVIQADVAWRGDLDFDPTFASANRFTALLFGTIAAGICTFLWAAQATERALSQAAAARRLALGAANVLGWTAWFVLLSAAFWLGITLSLESVLERLPRMALAAAATIPAILLVIAWASRWASAQNRPHEAWQRLNVEE